MTTEEKTILINLFTKRMDEIQDNQDQIFEFNAVSELALILEEPIMSENLFTEKDMKEFAKDVKKSGYMQTIDQAFLTYNGWKELEGKGLDKLIKQKDL